MGITCKYTCKCSYGISNEELDVSNHEVQMAYYKWICPNCKERYYFWNNDGYLVMNNTPKDND